MEEESAYELVDAKCITSLDKNPSYGIFSTSNQTEGISTSVKSQQVKPDLKKPTYSWVCYTFALVGIILVGSAAFASLAISLRNSANDEMLKQLHSELQNSHDELQINYTRSLLHLQNEYSRSLIRFQNEIQSNYSRSLMNLQSLVDELQTNNSRSLVQLKNLVDHNFELQTNLSRSLDSKIYTLHMIGQNPSNPVASCCHVLLLNLSSPSGHYWIRSSNGFAVRVYCTLNRQYADNCNGLMPSNLGLTEDNPASSCNTLSSNSPSGYYWIGTQGSPVRVYCNMNTASVNLTRGWMRVAYIDMRNTSHQCPSGLTLFSRSSAPRRVCNSTTAGCVSINFTVHGIEYSHMYGRIKGYQIPIVDAFFYSTRGIDSSYVSGVSLTHGRNPRKHIWTFAGALDEQYQLNSNHKCPCVNPNLSPPPTVPEFINNDYFCDTAIGTLGWWNVPRTLQPADPLWDGAGCGSNNTCCSFNNPPWFIKDLPSPTTDDVEMRLCRPTTVGSTPIELVELYVQ